MGPILAFAVAVLSAAPLPSQQMRWFSDEQRLLTGALPLGWHGAGAVSFAGDLAWGTEPIRLRGADRCPSGGLAPRGGGVRLYVLEYDVWSGGPRSDRVTGGFAAGRPAARQLLSSPVTDDACFGPSQRVRWHEHRRSFQANLFGAATATDRERREAAALFDSLRFRRYGA